MLNKTVIALSVLLAGWSADLEAKPHTAAKAHKVAKPKWESGAVIAKHIDAGLKSFRMVERDIFDKSSGGGDLKAYFKGDDAVKLDLTLRGDSGRTETAFYVAEGKLVFVRELGWQNAMVTEEGKTPARKTKQESDFKLSNPRNAEKYQKDFLEYLDRIQPRKVAEKSEAP
jgi:hypothetical protein